MDILVSTDHFLPLFLTHMTQLSKLGNDEGIARERLGDTVHYISLKAFNAGYDYFQENYGEGAGDAAGEDEATEEEVEETVAE